MMTGTDNGDKNWQWSQGLTMMTGTDNDDTDHNKNNRHDGCDDPVLAVQSVYYLFIYYLFIYLIYLFLFIYLLI